MQYNQAVLCIIQKRKRSPGFRMCQGTSYITRLACNAEQHGGTAGPRGAISGTWCLNRVVQCESEDVMLHVKAGADRLQDKRLDVRMRLILVGLPKSSTRTQSASEFSLIIPFLSSR